jgi:hypothetical protein
MNRVLVNSIRCLRSKNIKDWDRYIYQIAGAIRSSVNASTGYSANYMTFGREVNKPHDITFGIAAANREQRTVDEYIAELEEILRTAHTVARKNLNQAQAAQKERHDRNVHLNLYEVGDMVHILDETSKKGVSKKLLPIYKGPFLVTKVLSPVLVVIQSYNKQWTTHHNKLKPCLDRPESLPLWLVRRRHVLLAGEEVSEIVAPEDPLTDIQHLFEVPATTETHEVLADETLTNMDIPDNDDGPVNEDEVSDQVAHYTRVGRRVRNNPRYRDFV